MNGESKEVPDHYSLADLVRDLDLPSNRIAVELNRQVVRRSDWITTNLSGGDTVEVVHFVGGGV